MKRVGPTGSENLWKFLDLVTDYPLVNPVRQKMGSSSFYIVGDQAYVTATHIPQRIEDWTLIPHAEFPVSSITEVGTNEAGATIGSAIVAGLLGGLVGGGWYVVIGLRDSYSFAFKVGKKTNTSRQNAARISGEIKRAICGVRASADSPSMNLSETTCPYCAETIKAAAIKCRYCGSDLLSSTQS